MKKVISILVVLIMLISSIEVFASGTGIECTAETIDGVSYISGKIKNVSGIYEVTVLVGDVDNISAETVYYIDKTNTNANGEFDFAFRFPGGTPSGTYNYCIATNATTERYDGTIKYADPSDYMINQFINADLAVNISAYVPTISGTISCTEGKTVSIDILNKTDNAVIAEEIIVSEDGDMDVSYTLPGLLSPKEYELVLKCTEDDKEVVRAYATITSSGLMLEASGGITPADNVELDMQVRTKGIDLVNQNKKIIEAETFTGSLPNIVMSGSIDLDMQGYEVVWIDSADTDEEVNGDDSENSEENEENDTEIDQAETVVSKEISGGFEEQDEISEIESNSFDGSRKIVDNCYSGKFALEIKQRADNVLPIMESDYF